MWKEGKMREIKFRAWALTNTDRMNEWKMLDNPTIYEMGFTELASINTVFRLIDNETMVLMQYTGLKDKNGKEIYEGDIVGEEGVYHFLEREGWKSASGNWKIIGEKVKNFTGKGEEKYIAGYQLTAVEWVDTSCGFEPFSDSCKNCQCCGGGRSSIDFEVIGNIYENPELLEGGTE